MNAEIYTYARTKKQQVWFLEKSRFPKQQWDELLFVFSQLFYSPELAGTMAAWRDRFVRLSSTSEFGLRIVCRGSEALDIMFDDTCILHGTDDKGPWLQSCDVH